jgi:hypothetical protein
MRKIEIYLGLVILSWLLVGCDNGYDAGNSKGSKIIAERSSMVKKLSQMESGYSGSTADWREFLACWARTMEQPFTSRPMPNSVTTVQGVEGELPPSYRHFVEATGGAGWLFPGDKKRNSGSMEQLYPINRVGPFKKADPVTWKAWNDNRGLGKVPDKVYYDYSRQQNWGLFREEYLDSLVSVGDLWHGNVLVLNPMEKTLDGEWEAWFLSTKLPGAIRFKSFAELMQMVYFTDIDPMKDLLSYSDAELAQSCAGKLRVTRVEK